MTRRTAPGPGGMATQMQDQNGDCAGNGLC